MKKYRRNINQQFVFLRKEFFLIVLLFIVLSGIIGVTGYYIGFLMLPIILFKYRIKIDKELIWLLLFSFSYSLITTLQGLNVDAMGNMLFFSIYPPLFYLIGKYLISEWPYQKYFLLLYLAFSLSFLTLISVYYDIFNNGFLNLSRRITDVRFLNNITATLHGANVSLLVASVALIFAIIKKTVERNYKIIFVFFGVLSFISILHLNNRTGIVILGFSLILILIVNLKNYTIKRFLIIFMMLSIVSYFIYPLIYNTNIIDVYSSKMLDPDKGISTIGARDVRWVSGVKSLFNQPFGGGVYEGGVRYYAHNLWLDIAEMGGIIPFIAILIFTFHNVKENLYIVRNRKLISSFYVSVILVFNAGFLLTCFVEPMMEGRFIYVCGMFYFWGITTVSYQRIKILNKTNKMKPFAINNKQSNE